MTDEQKIRLKTLIHAGDLSYAPAIIDAVVAARARKIQMLEAS